MSVDTSDLRSETDITTQSSICQRKTRKPPVSPCSSAFISVLPKLNPSTLLKWHNLLLACHLTNLKDSAAISNDIPVNFKIITWNVNQALPQDVDLSLLLDSAFDIYVVNLQETISLTSLKKSTERIDDWGRCVINELNHQNTSKSFKVIYKTGLLGLTTILIANDTVVDQIHNINAETLGLGYLRWGNKGCISLKFRIGGLDFGREVDHDSLSYSNVRRLRRLPGVEVQVFNVHLVHGEGEPLVTQRFDSWAKIANKLSLIDPTVALTNTTLRKNTNGVKEERLAHSEADFTLEIKLSESEKLKLGSELKAFHLPQSTVVHDPKTCIFVSGDTNYRLKVGWDNYLGASFDRKNVDELVNSCDYADLILRDQLTAERFKNNVMIGFTEPEVTFPPTFKVDPSKPMLLKKEIATPNYDPKRLPAYTDRILFVPRSHVKLTKDGYTSIPIKGSDHFPVIASYNVTVPMVNQSVFHRHKEEFSIAWDQVLNSIKLIDIEPTVRVITKVGEINTPMDDGLFIQNLEYKGGLLSADVMCGECVIFGLNLKNHCDELLRFEFKDDDTSRWFSSNKTTIEFSSFESHEEDNGNGKKFSDMDYTLNGLTNDGLCNITPSGTVLTTVKMKTSTPGSIEKTFSISIPFLKSIPKAHKYFALTLNVKDIFKPALQKLELFQFENIRKAFDVLFSKTKDAHLLSFVENVDTPDEFTIHEWDLTRTLTLWKFEEHVNVQELFRVLYVWLKCQGRNVVDFSNERSKFIFQDVIRLIMWLKLDNNQGYTWFGWLFDDPEELLEYLERENYKFNLSM